MTSLGPSDLTTGTHRFLTTTQINPFSHQQPSNGGRLRTKKEKIPRELIMMSKELERTKTDNHEQQGASPN